ncbi:MAG: MBL fold metallo-hydrolase [Coraliomargaritaceae bacterium]
MKICTQELPPIGTNAILLLDPESGESLVIDAPEGAYDWAIQQSKENGCTIVGLILTHGHWDHILDAHKFAATGIPVYAHPEDAPLFEDPSRMANFAIPGLELQPVPINHWIVDGAELQLLGRQLEIRHVPGHCPGNILIYCKDEAAAIVGDAIFAGSVGRYDLPGGDGQLLMKSIREKIYTLPDVTTLYPGHGPTTTVGHEKTTNPFIRHIDKEVENS